jgi:ankyrin repeat protein
MSHSVGAEFVPRTNPLPLHAATVEGKTDVCRALIQAGANIDALGAKQQTALHLAAYEGNAHLPSVDRSRSRHRGKECQTANTAALGCR